MRTPALSVLALAALAVSSARAGTGAPYPMSSAVSGMSLDWSTYTRLAAGSDNWPTTWAGDGSLYASFGDGPGFAGGRRSLGFARLAGSSARTVKGTDLPVGPLRSGKSYGLLALGDTLYAFVSPGSNVANYREARLYRAPLGTGAWRRAGWAFEKNGPERIVLPTFLQAGKGYSAGGRYVYVYAPRYAPKGRGLSVQGGTGANGIALLRAPRDDLMDRQSWQYFAGLDRDGDPRWSGKPGALRPTINDAAGVGWTVSAVYDRPLRRYLVDLHHLRRSEGIYRRPAA